MGEARKQRMALRKQGLIELAKAPEQNPPSQNLVQITVLAKQMLADLIRDRYEHKVNHAAVPSLNAWHERLLVAGLASFDAEERKQAEAHQLIKLAGPQDIAKAAGGPTLT